MADGGLQHMCSGEGAEGPRALQLTAYWGEELWAGADGEAVCLLGELPGMWWLRRGRRGLWAGLEVHALLLCEVEPEQARRCCGGAAQHAWALY